MSLPLTDQILARIREAMALMLWELGAVKVNTEQPFKLVSGNYSPIYINCRQLISSPAFCDLFGATARIMCEANSVEFDVVAGGETAGIPFAAILARAFGKPMVYVRKAVKGHGLGSLVEGILPRRSRVLLTEDLITDAGSKLHFIKAIKTVGGTISNVLVVFDRLQGGGKVLAARRIHLLAVTDMKAALLVAERDRILNRGQLKSLNLYLASPRAWHKDRGLHFQE